MSQELDPKEGEHVLKLFNSVIGGVVKSITITQCGSVELVIDKGGNQVKFGVMGTGETEDFSVAMYDHADVSDNAEALEPMVSFGMEE